MLLEGADLNKFVYSIAKLIDAPVILLTNDLEYLESSLDADPSDIQIHSRTTEMQAHSTYRQMDAIDVKGYHYVKENIFFQPIFAGDQEFGYLVILLEAEKAIQENLIIAAEQASFLVAFLFQSEQALLEKERNHLSSFVRDVFNNQYSTETELFEKSKVFNWRFTFPLVMISIQANISDSEDRLALYYRILDSGLLERIIASTMEISEENCKVLYFNDSVLCFVSLKNEANLKSKLTRIGHSVESNFSDKGYIGVSISDVVYELEELRQAYSNSMLVFTIYKENLESKSFVHFYTDLGLFRLFHNIKDTTILEEFVLEKLGPVLEYDEGKEVKLLETLRYYIKNNTNVQKTADDLYVHYNTMRYRMNTIKELGIQLDNGFELTEISLACQLLQYLEMKKG
ncbi:helix-turn-helix domain-containing protein [Sporosarcina aquimarina]|uniref:Helix-turn-helix domain-containing protein n=1 Tax=Sporosarcina aquimarina TaxID=114975 RepID=A0ABU4G2F1_9BACL|nr:helix-turn-helix domain-containing protein [Sporosarcina aquimarina]